MNDRILHLTNRKTRLKRFKEQTLLMTDSIQYHFAHYILETDNRNKLSIGWLTRRDKKFIKYTRGQAHRQTEINLTNKLNEILFILQYISFDLHICRHTSPHGWQTDKRQRVTSQPLDNLSLPVFVITYYWVGWDDLSLVGRCSNFGFMIASEKMFLAWVLCIYLLIWSPIYWSVRAK